MGPSEPGPALVMSGSPWGDCSARRGVAHRLVEVLDVLRVDARLQPAREVALVLLRRLLLQDNTIQQTVSA